MANPNPNHRHHHHHAATMLIAFLLLTSSSARPLNDDCFSLAGTKPSLNLALPSAMAEEATPGHVSRCGHMRVAGGKYGALILNMLPKGQVPPSGPSQRTNNLNN